MPFVAGAEKRRAEEARKAVDVAEAYLKRMPADVKARNLVASATFLAALAAGIDTGLVAPLGAIQGDLRNGAGRTAGWARSAAQRRPGAQVSPARTTSCTGLCARPCRTSERARMLDEQRLAQDPTKARYPTRRGDRPLECRGRALAAGRPPGDCAIRTKSCDAAGAGRRSQRCFAQSRVAFVHAYLAWIYQL